MSGDYLDVKVTSVAANNMLPSRGRLQLGCLRLLNHPGDGAFRIIGADRSSNKRAVCADLASRNI
jgi:hypothetical protein